MSRKRLTYDNRISALNEAAAALIAHESESDEPGDVEARERLAEQLYERAERLKMKRDGRIYASRLA